MTRWLRVYEVHASDSPYNAHYDRPAVMALVGDVEGRRVLDAGRGPGLYAQEVVPGGADVVALVASGPMVALAARRLGRAAALLRADLNSPLPFADGRFDLVVCPLVIHHVDDRSALWRESCAVSSATSPERSTSSYQCERPLDIHRSIGMGHLHRPHGLTLGDTLTLSIPVAPHAKLVASK